VENVNGQHQDTSNIIAESEVRKIDEEKSQVQTLTKEKEEYIINSFFDHVPLKESFSHTQKKNEIKQKEKP